MFVTQSRVIALLAAFTSILSVHSVNATEQLYKRECNGCHSGPPTCNGCHAHGVHAKTADPDAINLVATTDKAVYAAGEDIVVTLTGGHLPQASGWVGAKLYDAKGVELAHARKTELPITLTTRAYAEMTSLYVAWIGHEYELAGGKFGAPVSGTISVGMREAFRAGVHEQEVHLEEIVATNTFAVDGSVNTTSDDAPTDGSSANTSDSGSAKAAAIDLLWLLVALVYVAYLRRRARWRSEVNADTGRSKTSNVAPV